MSLRILVIVAHADDIEFGIAGSIARWTDEGHQVTYCIVTDGAAGSNAPDADLEELVRTREAEQRQAAAVVGVSDVRFLGYPDGMLQHTLELRRDLTRLIRELKPHRVVCADPTLVFAGNFYINHPDHRAAAEAAVYATFPSAGTRPIFRELLAEGYEPHDVDELWTMFSDHADTVVDVSATIERKVEALLCHRSQVGPEVADMVRKWAAEEGQKHGYTFAETFRVIKLKDEQAQLQTQEAAQAAAD
ncbi:MAG: GlcNAc-PI de-N-acetylase [Chloroflexota bacterium]|nr:MAG: GlcNAc-PI de-N-acetylase [Chloroflexota bacterium]